MLVDMGLHDGYAVQGSDEAWSDALNSASVTGGKSVSVKGKQSAKKRPRADAADGATPKGKGSSKKKSKYKNLK